MTSIEEFDRRYEADATDEHVAFDRTIAGTDPKRSSTPERVAACGSRTITRDRVARIVGWTSTPHYVGHSGVWV